MSRLKQALTRTWHRFAHVRRMPRLAIVACVRNEASWLPYFLRYHHAIGVARVYLFCDRCQDESEEIAGSYPWVRVFRVDAAQAEQFPYIADLHRACMDRSLVLAREEGIDWLLIIDPDEFAFGNNPGRTPLDRAHLLPMIERARPETQQIRLPTREVVPLRLPEGTPFWRQRFVQRRPEVKWSLLDHASNQCHPWTGYLGHCEGKTLIRTSAAVQGYDSHRWVPDQRTVWPQRPEFAQVPTEDAGYHLHYYLTSHSHWIDKFRKQSFEPDVWICGSQVELPKQLLRRVATQLPSEQGPEYFERHIARAELELQDLTRQGTVDENLEVAEILDSLEQKVHPEAFYPLAPKSDLSDARRWGWSALEMPSDRREGFWGLERYRGEYFRWAQPTAAVRLNLPPADYRLRLDMKSQLAAWKGRMELSCEGRTIPCRDRSVHGGVVQQILRKEDIASSPFWLKLQFDPIDTRSWKNETRAVGAAIYSFFLEPLA